MTVRRRGAPRRFFSRSCPRFRLGPARRSRRSSQRERRRMKHSKLNLTALRRSEFLEPISGRGPRRTSGKRLSRPRTADLLSFSPSFLQISSRTKRNLPLPSAIRTARRQRAHRRCLRSTGEAPAARGDLMRLINRTLAFLVLASGLLIGVRANFGQFRAALASPPEVLFPQSLLDATAAAQRLLPPDVPAFYVCADTDTWTCGLAQRLLYPRNVFC